MEAALEAAPEAALEAALEVAAAEVAGPEEEAGVGVAWGVAAAEAECFNSQIYIRKCSCSLNFTNLVNGI